MGGEELRPINTIVFWELVDNNLITIWSNRDYPETFGCLLSTEAYHILVGYQDNIIPSTGEDSLMEIGLND